MVNISWAPRRRLGATAVAAAVGCTTVSFMWWRMKRRERASAAIRRHLLWDREQDRRQLTEASKDHPCIGEGDGRDDEDGCDAIAANVIFGTRSGISEFIAMLFPAVYFGKTWAKKTKRLRRTTSKKKLQDLARIERKSNSDLAALGRDPPAIQPSICFQGSGCVIVVSQCFYCSGPPFLIYISIQTLHILFLLPLFSKTNQVPRGCCEVLARALLSGRVRRRDLLGSERRLHRRCHAGSKHADGSGHAREFASGHSQPPLPLRSFRPHPR
jgi:hypothetical protein